MKQCTCVPIIFRANLIMRNYLSLFLQQFLLINSFFLNFVSSAELYKKLSIPEFHQVTPEIYRGGRPSMSDLQYLKSIGVNTIINIESDKYAIEKEKNYALNLGLNWISSPMSMEAYPSDEQLTYLEELLTGENNFPVFIHCKHGQDRTGLIIGLYRTLVQNWTPASSYKEMLQNGFHPEYELLDQCYRDKTGYRKK